MTAPLSEQQLATIRGDLAAVPAPPWRWIGFREAGGPQLVTDHSGRQYLLRAAKPRDGRGDELVDPVTDYPVYGDLQFRDQRPGEKYSTMRSGSALAIGRTSYDPDSIIAVDNPIARWLERSAAHAAALLAEVDRLQAESEQRRQQAAASAASEETLQAQIDAQAKEVDRLRAERDAFADRVDTLTSVAQGNKRHVMDLMGDLSAAQSRIAELETAGRTVFRAEHPDSGITLGHYATAEAARAHCEAFMRRERPDAALDWIEDEEDVAELVAEIDGQETVTGYLVTALTVPAAYDPEVDE